MIGALIFFAMMGLYATMLLLYQKLGYRKGQLDLLKEAMDNDAGYYWFGDNNEIKFRWESFRSIMERRL